MYRSMEQNREFRNIHINVINSLGQKSKGNSMKKGWSFQQKMLKQFGIYNAKKYKGFTPFTNINLKWITELNVKCKVKKLYKIA